MSYSSAADDPDWAFALPWLTSFGIARLNDDYQVREQFVPDRPGGPGRVSRLDFAAGWIAALVRHKLWSYFTPEGRRRFEHSHGRVSRHPAA